MSDDSDTSEKRPNAKYNLSYPDTPDGVPEGLVFHYNRDRRLANAPESVRNLYKEEKKSRFGLFSVLVADRPRKILFFMIILLCGLIFALSRMGFFDTSLLLEGNKIEITGTLFEETTIVLVRKIINNQDFYTGAVDVAVSVPSNEEDLNQIPVFYHRVFFTMENDEIYRFAVPFNSKELLMVLQTEKSTLQLTFKPQ